MVAKVGQRTVDQKRSRLLIVKVVVGVVVAAAVVVTRVAI